jgi:tRNA A-37 threonylcarbamoyl transferase component Bud32
VPIEPGTKLGQYEVLELIGEGAMGTVYRAYHEQLARTGAVKVMHAISPDKDSISRFRHEAQAIARMRHPNILNVFDFGEYEGTPYMIVEFVPGGNLAGRMTQGLLDRGTALRFLRGIGAGLDYAHSQGIVHRDVKPANVLLERDETPVLADFGLAKMLQGSSVKSMTGVTTGTPAYMAPEQVTGQQVGPAADRYSLATIAYEMLTGAIPFEGLGVLELLYAHVHQDPVLPSSLNSTLNQSVDAVIMRGLAKEPRSRWATCEAFINALATAMGAKIPASVERTIAIAPPAESSVGTPLFAPPPPTIPSPVWLGGGDVATRREARMRRFVIAAIAILALAALIVGIVGFVLRASAAPALGLSSSTVHAGDTLTVTASHLPASQNGEIQLRSVLHTFPFTADGSGNASVQITVPVDAGIGDHTVSICWSGTCHAQTTIVVTAPLALPSPSPTATPLAARPSITLSTAVVKIGGPLTISGHHFDPSKPATVVIYQAAVPHTLVSAPVSVASDGTFVVRVRMPASLKPGKAEIMACIYSGSTVQPTSSQCGAKPLVLLS